MAVGMRTIKSVRNLIAGEGLRELFGNTREKSGDVGPSTYLLLCLRFTSHLD